jgi:hypothetical protein
MFGSTDWPSSSPHEWRERPFHRRRASVFPACRRRWFAPFADVFEVLAFGNYNYTTVSTAKTASWARRHPTRAGLYMIAAPAKSH